jgi:hypothetical protein
MEIRKKLSRELLERRMALGLAAAMLAIASWSAPCYAGANSQQAELHQLQAAFHRAASVQDPVNGDSAAVIDQRIRDMLSLWTDDGSLTLEVGGALDGDYVGNGDPADPSTCPTPSGDPTNRGTLCTLFKYVSGSFQPANKFVSLAPAFLTEFGVHGNTATVYFQCHYFNVAINPATGKPFWTAASHLVFDGTTSKIHGTWLFSHANVPVAGVPTP